MSKPAFPTPEAIADWFEENEVEAIVAKFCVTERGKPISCCCGLVAAVGVVVGGPLEIAALDQSPIDMAKSVLGIDGAEAWEFVGGFDEDDGDEFDPNKYFALGHRTRKLLIERGLLRV